MQPSRSCKRKKREKKKRESKEAETKQTERKKKKTVLFEVSITLDFLMSVKK